MSTALRALAVAVLGVALLPAAAFGAEVARTDTGIITIVDNVPAADDIQVERLSRGDIVRGDGLTLAAPDPGDCAPDLIEPDAILCATGTSLAVDLGAENDEFSAIALGSPISVAGGSGNDNLSTSGADDVLAGGSGNDTLRGNSGVDSYFGETGDDVIQAQDKRAERIACGAGTDTAENDFIDIIAECERGVDGDGDGFSTAVDCNDAAANVHPGAPEAFENGVDENCDGRDNPNLDRDADGFPQPGDCDDGNAAIRPGALEIRGNPFDENCDRRADPFAQLGAVVTNQWAVLRTHARLLALVVHTAPVGARVVLTCRGRGCPFKRARRRTVTRNLQRITLHRGFRRARLRFGTRLRLSITATGTVGRTYTYVVKRGELPRKTTVCRAPGEARGRSC
jgi:hypothetical protein